ncbi:NAD(P)-binding domain-containing protein [Rubripirellula amarantea]|nr:NAD(P)-binding domain-containing protein [Rubripirellula amarantea]
MKIGIIGAATVGTTIAARLVAVGHEVLVANSRGGNRLRDRLAEVDSRITPASVAEACQCDVVFLAVPWTRIKEVLTPERDWAGRILVDATNIFLSYEPEFRIDDLQGDSGSEIVARLAPSARTVKAFNTLPIEKMFAPTDAGYRRVLFLAGDDSSALATIQRLIEELGFHAIQLGSLAAAGRQMELNGPFSGIELLIKST